MEGIREPLWGQWYLGEQLYAGGDTEVWTLTRRGGSGRACVVKCLRIAAGDAEALSAANEERRVQERMADSGGAVAILDDLTVQTPDGWLVLLRLERLDCLAELMREGAQLSEPEVCRLAEDLLHTLVFAHRLNIVHRDIKPANIYRAPSGRYKLGDFGVSARTDEREPGALAGTAAYMAPEAAAGKPSGAPEDLYSLGIVLYQLLNGNFLPMTHDGSSHTQVQNAIAARLRGQRIPRVSCRSARLRRAVMRACSPDPKKRWGSAEQMLAALTQKKRPPAWAAGLLCALALAAGLAAGRLLGTRRAAVEPAPAEEQTALQTGQAASDTPVAVTERAEPEPVDSGDAVVHRYELIRQALGWEDARIWCESRGGHLATITSQEESAQVLALLDEAGMQAVWLGADNRNAAYGFEWVTGEPFSYAEWGAGEPNNDNGVEYYLMLQNKDGQGWVWNDSRADGFTVFDASACGFVCEWEGAS